MIFVGIQNSDILRQFVAGVGRGRRRTAAVSRLDVSRSCVRDVVASRARGIYIYGDAHRNSNKTHLEIFTVHRVCRTAQGTHGVGCPWSSSGLTDHHMCTPAADGRHETIATVAVHCPPCSCLVQLCTVSAGNDSADPLGRWAIESAEVSQINPIFVLCSPQAMPSVQGQRAKLSHGQF